MRMARPLALCLSLLAISAFPMAPAQATSAPPIFPPASVFIFSNASVGGTTKITPNTPHPAGAVSDTEYCVISSLNGSYGMCYDVDVFRSDAAAKRFDTQQRAQTLADGRNHLSKIERPIAPGEWLTVSPRYLYVDAQINLIYRNVALSAGNSLSYSPTSTSNQKHVIQEAVQSLLDMAARLLDRAQDFAAHRFHAPPARPPINAAPGPVLTATPAAASLISQEGALWGADNLLTTQLSNIQQMQQVVQEQLASPADLVQMAQGQLTGSLPVARDMLNSVRMTGVEATAQRYLFAAITALTQLDTGIADSGGATADANLYNAARTDILLSEQLVPLPG